MGVADEHLTRTQAVTRLPLSSPVGAADGPALRMLWLQTALGLDDEALVAEVSSHLPLRLLCGLAANEPTPTSEELAAVRRQVRLSEHDPSANDRPTTPTVISVVSPVFQAEDLVEDLVRQVKAAVGAITPHFEILLVDDGSRDQSWKRIEQAASEDPRVKALRLMRNFGQHAAITAGLDAAAGEWIVVMDCDLQDDPSYIPAMLESARQGHDVVFAVKERRRHSLLKNLGGRLFARALNWLGGRGHADPNVGAYTLLSRRAVEAFRSVREVHGHYLGVLRWLALPSARVTVEHRDRPSGGSSYSPGALLRHGLVGVAVHSHRLLYIGLGASVLFAVAALIAAGWLVGGYYLHGYREGWTSTMVLVLVANAVTLFAVGTIGVYIARIFDQVKQRPLYLTRERVNL